MSAVVSDTSPLQYLVESEAIEILPALFKEVLIPPTVHRELQHQKTPPRVREWTQKLPPWIKVQSPSVVDDSLNMLRFRWAEQMATLDEWNVELVLLNSHDRGCAYQLHAGIYRRICSNGLVVSEASFEAIRFRHSKLETDEVVRASFRLLEFFPKVGEMVNRFRERLLDANESLDLARHAVLLRYPSLDASPVEPEPC